MNTTAPIRVFLIRHGESLANAGHVTSDPSSIPLTAQGWVQARHVAASFEHEPSMIITSSYLRTQQTAEPTQKRFPQIFHEIWLVHEFTYLSPNHCVNMTAAQRRPLVQEYWERCDPDWIDGPGAESFASLIDRAQQMLLRIQELECGDIAIFTHGQYMQMVIWLIQNPSYAWSPQAMRAWRERILAVPIHNAQIIRLTYSDHKGWTVSGSPEN